MPAAIKITTPSPSLSPIAEIDAIFIKIHYFDGFAVKLGRDHFLPVANGFRCELPPWRPPWPLEFALISASIASVDIYHYWSGI